MPRKNKAASLAQYPLIKLPSNMIFTPQLSQAISGNADARMLNLTCADAAPHHSLLIGARVQLRLTVEESGKTPSAYPILLDLEVSAARALAQSIAEMADRAESMTPGRGW